jgi:hypothetical protein
MHKMGAMSRDIYRGANRSLSKPSRAGGSFDPRHMANRFLAGKAPSDPGATIGDPTHTDNPIGFFPKMRRIGVAETVRPHLMTT